MSQCIHGQFPQGLTAQNRVGGIGDDPLKRDARLRLIQIIGPVEADHRQIQLNAFIFGVQPAGFEELRLGLRGLVGGGGHGACNIMVGNGVPVGFIHPCQGIGRGCVICAPSWRFAPGQAGR